MLSWHAEVPIYLRANLIPFSGPKAVT